MMYSSFSKTPTNDSCSYAFFQMAPQSLILQGWLILPCLYLSISDSSPFHTCHDFLEGPMFLEGCWNTHLHLGGTSQMCEMLSTAWSRPWHLSLESISGYQSPNTDCKYLPISFMVLLCCKETLKLGGCVSAVCSVTTGLVIRYFKILISLFL